MPKQTPPTCEFGTHASWGKTYEPTARYTVRQAGKRPKSRACGRHLKAAIDHYAKDGVTIEVTT